MAIVILNVSQKHGLKYGKGKQIYEVAINNNSPLFSFEHIFEDGIAECLKKASIAAKDFEKNKKNINAYIQLMENYMIGTMGKGGKDGE